MSVSYKNFLGTETVLATSQYIYGYSDKPNREIHFLEGDKEKSIYAVVLAQTSNGWINISKVDPNQIKVEKLSKSDKIASLKAQKMYNQEIYTKRFKTWTFGCAKAAQFVDHK